LRAALPGPYYLFLKTYLTDRYFQVRYKDASSDCHEVKSGVPQGSVLVPLLYLLFTAVLPTTEHTTIATFADDTGLLAVHSDTDDVRDSTSFLSIMLTTLLCLWVG
jgi:hypothetical protein